MTPLQKIKGLKSHPINLLPQNQRGLRRFYDLESDLLEESLLETRITHPYNTQPSTATLVSTEFTTSYSRSFHSLLELSSDGSF